MIGADIARIAVGQIKRKEINLLLNATQYNNRFAKVRLTMPGGCANGINISRAF